MEKFKLDKDIKVMYVTAKSFPEGIMDALNEIRSIVPDSNKRNLFGISRPENGKIVYRAGLEELEKDESKKYSCESTVIPKGEYISITVKDYTKNIQSIGNAIHKLIAHPDIESEGHCIEWYLNDKDMRCMVKLHSFLCCP